MKKGIYALSPLILFIVLYLITSIIIGDFYKIPITVAFLISSIYALLTSKGTIDERINIFSEGAGSKNMMYMLWIFILAGAFASTAKSMGAVDATVNLTLRILPDSLLLPGLFIASCFISLAIGTSVGTIAALVPVATGIAQQADINTSMIIAIIVGGAYFGDNLSFISDTTIVATQTQECRMSDKFRVNSKIVFPVALFVLVIYLFKGLDLNIQHPSEEINLVKIIPYLTVIIVSLCGINVMIVLIIGIILSGIIGIIYGDYSFFGWFESMSNGMLNMSELIIMTLLAAGMLAIIKHNGGIDYIIKILTKNIKGKKGAEMSIAVLTWLVNICTANNTVAIITVGPIAKNISQKYGIDKRKCASILDTASCSAQGLLPYGAQMLIAAGLASINPVSIIPYLFYPIALIIAILVSILFRYPRKYS